MEEFVGRTASATASAGRCPGIGLAEYLFDRGWIERVRESRAVRITEPGRRELKRRFGVLCPDPTLR